MNIEKEREAFSNWHESEYGEHVTWWDDVPASHIHNDRWSGWKASALRAEKLEGCVVVPVNNTTIVAIEKMVEQQVEASGITADIFRLDGEKILNAAVEAARGGK